jgi:thiol:disulfide interchange protein DsbD
MERRILHIAALLAVPATAGTCAAVDEANPVQATLVAESPALTPGASVRLGLRLQHAANWHTYWRNPGDSGLPTRLKFTLPAGYSVEDIAWPAPMRFDVGGLYNFGYTGDMLLPVKLHVPADAKAGDAATIGAEANWLMCREECIPGKAHLSLILPVLAQAAKPNKAYAGLFAHATERQPQDVAWRAQAHVTDQSVMVTLLESDLTGAEGLDAFVEERKVVNYAPPKISSAADGIELVFPKSDYFDQAPARLNLLLVGGKGTPLAWHVSVPVSPP